MLGIKVWLRPVVLAAFMYVLVFFGYYQPGYSNTVWTRWYNLFAGLVFAATVVFYAIAINDAYRIRALNSAKAKPDGMKKWKGLWSMYESSFLVGHRRTTEYASTYFNPDNLLSSSFERIPLLSILKAMPGTFTGLGILGTFIGFSAGLADFDPSTAETMQESIKTLLTGINTAFNTSIIGVVLSIVFNFMFLQPLLKRLDNDSDILAARLDDEFYIDSIDHLKEMFAFDENGVSWLPKDYNRVMLAELKSQTVSLANFTTDLSDSMQNLADSLVSSYRQEMKEMLDKDLRPVLERLAAATDKLQAEKAESTDQAMNGIVERLERSLTVFMSDFKDNVTSQTKQEMEGLADRLNEAGSAIAGLPGMMATLKTDFEAMAKQFVKAINDVTMEGSTLQSQNIEELRSLAARVQATMESFSRTIHAAESQNKHAEKIASSLEEVADATSVAATDLSRAFKDQTTRSSELLAAVGKEAEGLRSAVETAAAAARGFNDLDEALAHSFEVLNEGLIQYNNTTKDGLSSQLERYSQTISGFAERLAGAVEQVGELVGDLTDAIESVKRSS